LIIGELKALELRRWLVDFKKDSKSKSSSSDGEDSVDEEEPASKPKAEEREDPFDPVVYRVSNQTVFEEHCVQAASKFPSSFCVLSFLPPLEEEFEESVKQHRNLIAILTELKKDLYEARKSNSPLPRVNLMWLDGSQEENFKLLQRFGVATDLPSVVFVKPDKKIVGPYIGGFEKESLLKGIREAAKGRGRLYKYNFDINVFSEKIEGKSAESCGDDDSEEGSSGQCTAPPGGKSHDEL
jgi:hypothetical protein